MSLRERFMTKFTPEPMSGCWLWTACCNSEGYGQIGNGGRGQTLKAHRASWMLFRGPIPDGLLVRHKCDNPACVNPAHLELGTDLDNTRDRDSRGRSWQQSRPEVSEKLRGERNGGARLTADQVREIRKACRSGELHRDIAARFGTHKGNISKIHLGTTWSHIQ